MLWDPCGAPRFAWTEARPPCGAGSPPSPGRGAARTLVWDAGSRSSGLTPAGAELPPVSILQFTLHPSSQLMYSSVFSQTPLRCSFHHGPPASFPFCTFRPSPELCLPIACPYLKFLQGGVCPGVIAGLTDVALALHKRCCSEDACWGRAFPLSHGAAGSPHGCSRGSA